MVVASPRASRTGCRAETQRLRWGGARLAECPVSRGNTFRNYNKYIMNLYKSICNWPSSQPQGCVLLLRRGICGNTLSIHIQYAGALDDAASGAVDSAAPLERDRYRRPTKVSLSVCFLARFLSSLSSTSLCGCPVSPPLAMCLSVLPMRIPRCCKMLGLRG